ncbi:MAG: type I pullulanase [Bacilli bacterium]|nr:type I pullulanase [Bacilli bacterium]
MLKKIILFLTLGVFTIFAFISTNNIQAEEMEPDTLIVHYFRYNGDYGDGWNLWMWPENGNGNAYNFDTTDSEIVTDGFGAVATIDMVENGMNTVSKIGVIVRLNNWERKDVDKDRFINVPETVENGELHIYLVEGDERIGYSIDDPNGPDKTDKIISAYFIDVKTISFSMTSVVSEADITLKINDVVTEPKNITLVQNKGTMELNSDVDLSNTYVIEVDFSGNTKDYIVTFDGIYDTEAFVDAYFYDGDDLGAIVDGNTTSFKVWAPISSQVVLNIYDSGTPASLIAKDATATDTPSQTITMTRSFNGTWVASVNSNLHGKYYTYSVTNGISTNEVVDPYAKSAGVNGLRGMVVDFDQTNPDDFEYGVRPDNMENYTDAVIYELHVRDLTTHSSWQVDSQYESYRGKFMGMTVRGTTYNGIATGLDHIIDLGVTHVQLLPFFDYGNAVDESGSATQFNWGYMPLNFNVLEGYYSTNPYDGAVRINEFKQVVTTFTENDLRIVMDVVYNHTGQSGDSNFNLILPGYYYRMNSDGSFSNGSGTGNETASERAMMQKFMVDSVSFWASEYNISGFRFDLMALHDTQTMNMITDALHDIDDTIIVYGEPWTGGGSPLASDLKADKNNLEDMPGVAAFNDEIRNSVKGPVFGNQATVGGFVQNDLGEENYITNQVRFGITGGVVVDGVDGSFSQYNINGPAQLINYVSAHDNNTLYDKIVMSTSFNQREFRAEMQKQANAIVLLSQGIPFIHAGAEFMRSKPLSNGTGFDENSYQSPDSTNQLRWDMLAEEENYAVYEYYRDMIAFRLNHPAFRMTDPEDIAAAIEFIDYGDDTLIAYTLSNYANNDMYDTILVIHNTGEFAKYALPEGEWYLIGNSSGVSEEIIKTYADGSDFIALENETLIFYTGEVVEPVNPDGGCGSCDTVSYSLIIFGMISLFGFFIYRRKF